MNCEETMRLIDAYVDQELFLKDSLELEKHIKNCRTCHERYANLTAMRGVLCKVPRIKPGLSLQENIQANLTNNRGFATRNALRSLSIGLPAFAAGLFFYGLVLSPYLQPHAHLAETIVSSHIHSLMAAHMLDIANSDKHVIKPWMNTVLDFSAPVEDMTAHGFTLLGARLEYIDQRKALALVYQIRRHYINVFIWPENFNRHARKPISSRGFRIRYWSADGLGFAAVSDTAEGDLNRFVAAFTGAGDHLR